MKNSDKNPKFLIIKGEKSSIGSIIELNSLKRIFASTEDKNGKKIQVLIFKYDDEYTTTLYFKSEKERDKILKIYLDFLEPGDPFIENKEKQRLDSIM